MKKYKFLFKPLFFIASLLFASWLVLAIEKIQPSDFGKYESLFKSRKDTPAQYFIKKEGSSPDHQVYNKEYLKRLFQDYKRGLIDSTALEEKLGVFFPVNY